MADLTYTKTTYVNDSEPALDADNLNNAENQISALTAAVNAQATINTNLAGNFASEYSPSATYAVNAYRTYQNVLYKCTTAITTPEAWNSAHWTSVKVMDEIAYPVGAIYLSVNSTSPASIFGGTWEQIKDRFMLACGNTYAAGSTGGEAQHTLTVDEMPSHNHYSTNGWRGISTTRVNEDIFLTFGKAKSDTGGVYHDTINGLDTTVSSAGRNKAHNNMPPYIAIYAWKRTA